MVKNTALNCSRQRTIPGDEIFKFLIISSQFSGDQLSQDNFDIVILSRITLMGFSKMTFDRKIIRRNIPIKYRNIISIMKLKIDEIKVLKNGKIKN